MPLSAYQRQRMRTKRRNGRTPAEDAAWHNDLDSVRAYLEAGYPAQLLVQYAVTVQGTLMLNVLRDHGADLTLANAQGETLLMLAAQRGHLDQVQWLVEQGGSINAVAHDGMTALAHAASARAPALVTWLLDHGAFPDVVSDHTLGVGAWSALHWAANYAFPEGLLASRPKKSTTQTAARMTVMNLLAKGADCNVENPSGDTPLMMALRVHDAEVLDVMAEGAIDIDRRSEGRHITPLGVVLAKNFQRPTFDWVMAQRPVLDSPVFHGQSALEAALSPLSSVSQNVNEQAYCLERLLNAGAHPHQTLDSKTAPFVLFLQQAFTHEPRGVAFQGKALWQAWTQHPKFNVDELGTQGESALHSLLQPDAKGWNTLAIERLIELGANVNALTRQGLSPLACLFLKPWPREAEIHTQGQAVFDRLLKEGADAQRPFATGMVSEKPDTLLHRAVWARASMEVVQTLIDLGVNVHATDHKGNTPLHLAARHGLTDIAKGLLHNGANSSFLNLEGQRPDELVPWMSQNGGEDLAKLLFIDHERRALTSLNEIDNPALQGGLKRARSRL